MQPWYLSHKSALYKRSVNHKQRIWGSFAITAPHTHCLSHTHILPLQQHWSNENPWNVNIPRFPLPLRKETERQWSPGAEFNWIPAVLLKMNGFRAHSVAVSRIAFSTGQGRNNIYSINISQVIFQCVKLLPAITLIFWFLIIYLFIGLLCQVILVAWMIFNKLFLYCKKALYFPLSGVSQFFHG